MLKHHVFGNGNLGKDLMLKIGEEHLFDENEADVLWCCVGCGGPTDDVEKYGDQAEAHIAVPVRMAKELKPYQKLVVFSTHYLNDDQFGQRSFYAKTKFQMEQMLLGHPSVSVVRVGSLYGKHFPLKTLPGKVLKASSLGKKVFRSVPNLISPTPTEWLAEYLLKIKVWELHGLSDIGPQDPMNVDEWMGAALEDCGAQIIPGKIDPAYPENSASMCDHAVESCQSLWRKYGPGVLEAALSELGRS
jgi:hypothetical protein